MLAPRIGVVSGGSPVNINADYAASHIASAMKVDKLIYVTDQDGIYAESRSVYSKLSNHELFSLIENQIVEGGMLTKVRAILSALNGSLKHVHILNGNKRHVLIEELFTEQGVGTLCNAE
jgi:acetylglutamate kinase